jgi:hypothetical protein
VCERAFGLLEQSSTRREFRLLFEQFDASAGMKTDVAPIGSVQARQEAKQGRFARAVATDQADPLAVMQLEGDILEERPPIEAAAQSLATQK